LSTSKRILIIDDDIDFVRQKRAVLERHGYEVLSAHTGDQGLDVAREMKPDAIILDYMIDTPTAGAPVAQKLREEEALRRTPILLATAMRSVKPWIEGFAPNEDWLPVDKVLDKPVSAETLLAEIAQALAER